MSPQDLKNAKLVHFIGVGGIGTSAIARMFLLEGKKVSGSDMAESEVTNALKEAGATICIGEDAKNIPADCELVIYTIAVPKEHAELVEAKKRGVPVISYPEVLGIISKDKYTIAITGTHGKTTTTAMIAKIMMDAGLDPTVIIGSFLHADTRGFKTQMNADIGDADGRGYKDTQIHVDGNISVNQRLHQRKSASWTNFVAGKSKYLVVEGCEYCRSLLNLSPSILVITNIDADHLDYYRDMEDIVSAFVELSQKLPKDGYLIMDSHAPNLQAVVKQSHSQNADFEVLKLPSGFRLHIPGAHNLLNAKAAWGVAKVLGIGDVEALRSLSEFRGTWRRFEYRGKAKNCAHVYDDYGHHPTEIAATLQGTRELFPLSSKGGSASGGNKGGVFGGLSPKIVVVFQPHF